MARQIRVLLVDDHTTFRQALRADLESFDNVEIVGEAVNGEDAVASAAKLQPTVVVMDINMPKMDGITATRVIKAQHPKIVVIGFSVDAKDYQLYAMQKAGASRIISKDTSVAELHRAIQETVGALDFTLGGISKAAEQKRPATLGDVLYANSKAPVPEQDWETLVQSIAQGNQAALHGLYERAHVPVFTLIMRIMGTPEIAEGLTVDVFHDVWRRASRYEPGNGTVLGWIMNQARSRAIGASRLINRTSDSQNCTLEPLGKVTADPVNELDAREARQSLPAAAARDLLCPAPSVQTRLALRMVEETGRPLVVPSESKWSEPEWERVAPGIECKLLATDTERHRVSMLVRLVPGGIYPGHTHAGVEELHLLDGELWIEDRKLVPGDYNHCTPGTGDDRVWSETGCTCVLITSTRDTLR